MDVSGPKRLFLRPAWHFPDFLNSLSLAPLTYGELEPMLFSALKGIYGTRNMIY